MTTPDEHNADAAVHHTLSRLRNTPLGREVLAGMDDFTLMSAEAMSREHEARMAERQRQGGEQR